MSNLGTQSAQQKQFKVNNPLYHVSKFYQERLLITYQDLDVILQKVVEDNKTASTKESIDFENRLKNLRAKLHPAHNSSTNLTDCIRLYSTYIFDKLGVMLSLSGDVPQGDFQPFMLSVITDFIGLCCLCASRCDEKQLTIQIMQEGNNIAFKADSLTPALIEQIKEEQLLPALALCLDCGESISQLSYGTSSLTLCLNYVGDLALPNKKAKKTLTKPTKPALTLSYIDKAGQFTSRGITPLRLSKEEGEYQLLAHCHVRDDVRTFNINSVVGEFVNVETGMPITLSELNTLCANQEEFTSASVV